MTSEKKNHILFRGIFPALVTPLDEAGAVRTGAVKPLIDWMLSQGVDGFYVLGGTGEGGVLPERERMRMAEAAADAVRGTGARLILHVGAADTQSAIRLARHAGTLGVDAISSVYPNFFCSYGLEEAADCYRALIQASGLPMLGYCSAMLRDQSPLTVVERLMRIDGMIGVKYTFPNYYQLQQIKRLCGGNINVINGPDESLLCGLCMGADGGIGANYNLVPGQFAALYRAFSENDLTAAMRMQEQINRLITVICRFGLIPAIKCVLAYMGFPVGDAAFPGHRFSAGEKHDLIEALRGEGVLPAQVNG